MQSSYEFVPDLIDNEKTYSKKLKDRVKVNGIFNEINLSANYNLKKFIQMSNTRYKNIKSGISINNFLERQKGEYEELSNKILENNLYNSNEVENEAEKLYKKVGTKECKNLFKIRQSILFNSKNLSKSEILLRKKYEEKINLSKNKRNEEIERTKKEIKELENFLKSQQNLTVEEKINYLTNLIDVDSKYLNSNFKNYKNFLNDMEKAEDKTKLMKILNKNDELNHKYNFRINNIKFLSFKEDKREIIKKQKKEEKFDFKKLAKYTRHGNKKFFEKQIKEKSIQRLNSVRSNLKNKNSVFHRNISQKNSSFTNIDFNKTYKDYKDISINNNNISSNTMYESNNLNNSRGFSKTTFGNFRNTIKTVKSEAEFIRNISQNFDIKRQTVNRFFENKFLPRIEDYDILNKQNTVNENNKNRANLYKEQESDTNNMNSIYEFNFVKNKENEDYYLNGIMNSYKTTFYKKMKGWTKEQNKKEKKKKMEKARREISRQFIQELKKVKRKPNLFVDMYSLRDGVTNEKIKLLNKSLKMPIYSKHMRENIINDFNNFIQKKEKERKLNEELIKKKQLEEEEMLKKYDENYQLMKKLRKNLNVENKINEEESKINFNYKYAARLFKNKEDRKNKVKEAFNEYLLSLNNAKLKSAQIKNDTTTKTNEVEEKEIEL